MLSRRSGEGRKSEGEQGFTLAETAVGLAAAAVLASVVYASALSGSSSAERLTRSVIFDMEVLRLDQVLRGGVARLATPFWLPAVRSEVTRDGVRLFHLDGESDRYLELTRSGSRLEIWDGRHRELFPSVEQVRVRSRARSRFGVPPLSFDVTFVGGERISIVVLPGAFPLPGDEAALVDGAADLDALF